MIRLNAENQILLTPPYNPLPAKPDLWIRPNQPAYTDAANHFAAANKEYLTIASNPTLQTGDIDFEIGAWVRVDATTGVEQPILLKYVSAASGEYVFRLTAALAIQMYITDTDSADSISSTVPLAIGSWYFVRGWRKTSGEIGVQLNEVSYTKNSSIVPIHESSIVRIGVRGAACFNGTIDSVYFKKGISTPEEATSLYNAGQGRTYADLTAANGLASWKSNLVSWWDLDEDGASLRMDSHGTNNLTPAIATGGSGIGPSRTGGIAKRLAIVSDPISQLLDQSISLNHFSQTDLTKRPVLSTIGTHEAYLFDGVNDAIVHTGDIIGVGDISIVAVIRASSYGGSQSGRIIDNGQTLLLTSAGSVPLNTVKLTSRNGTLASSAANALALNTSYVVAVTRTAAGVANIYIDGALSGAANQSSGIPVAGGNTYLGNNAAGNGAYNGILGEVLLFNSIIAEGHIQRLTKYLRYNYGF